MTSISLTLSHFISYDIFLYIYRDTEYEKLGDVLKYNEREEWECEFHVKSHWAPVIIVSSLAALIAFLVLMFVCKRKIAKCAKQNAYEEI